MADVDSGSESDGGDFNPAPAIASDDEAESHDGDTLTKNPKQAPQRQKRPASFDDEDDELPTKQAQTDADEEEDEEDDDDDEEEDVTGRPRKRTRRDPRNQFLDIMAEVDDDEDEGDEDDEGDPGFITEVHPDDLAADLPVGVETDDRGHRELDRKREREQQMDAEKQAQLLKERYGRSRTTTTDVAVVPKRLLLPSVDDPSIWGTRCKPGKEREVIMSIMKRIDERAFSKNPMPIISAFERGGTMLGYIYVEARKQGDIIAALEGIMNVYPRTKMVLVPIKEMPDLLRVRKTEQLQPGGYVRLKRGKYAGDLAQIDDVETNGLEVSLRIVPRLDYGQDDDHGPAIDARADAQKRKRQGLGAVSGARPPQRLFSDVEAKKQHSKYLQSMSTFDKKHWTYLGDTYINGFLIKDFKLQLLVTEKVNPTLEEVTRFTAGAEDGTENLDLTALAASLKNHSANDNYLPGDMVEVYEGEQQGVIGKAVTVQGDIVTLSVMEGGLRGQTIEVPAKGLRKRFTAGDHVKVIGGSRYRDEVGMVVNIKEDRVTILSDLSMQEITVFSKDLREATDSGMAGGLGRYDIHDLVQLDAATVGCIIKVDRETLRLIDQNGSVKNIIPSQISNKIEKRKHAVATDRNGSEIRQDDTVREVGGEQKQGVIMHIHHSFLFLHNREQTENSGIVVVRSTNVATVAAKGGRVAQAATGPDLMKMNPDVQRNGTRGNASMAPPKNFGRDRTLGQTVLIGRGPYKGLLGIVKDGTDREARVELHTKSKTITVAKEILKFKDPISGNSIDYASFAGRGRGSASQSTAPTGDWQGSRTPMATGAGSGAGTGGRTPAWGAAPSRTPAWIGGNTASVGRTPAWKDPSGGRTPAWSSDGARTSYGAGAGAGAGGRTPAWNTGERTSYGDAPIPTDDFASGSKTPTHNTHNTDVLSVPARLPAFHESWTRPQDAPTPAAATPSNGYSAPTPAAAAPTPRYSGYAIDAPTPAGAPTPYGAQAETPAAVAWSAETPAAAAAAWNAEEDHDAPRYEDSPSPE